MKKTGGFFSDFWPGLRNFTKWYIFGFIIGYGIGGAIVIYCYFWILKALFGPAFGCK